MTHPTPGTRHDELVARWNARAAARHMRSTAIDAESSVVVPAERAEREAAEEEIISLLRAVEPGDPALRLTLGLLLEDVNAGRVSSRQWEAELRRRTAEPDDPT